MRGTKLLMKSVAETVSVEDFEILAVIGRGSFGKIYKAKLKNNNKIFAIKAFRKDELIEQNCLKDTAFEKDIGLTLSYPFLTKIYYVF